MPKLKTLKQELEDDLDELKMLRDAAAKLQDYSLMMDIAHLIDDFPTILKKVEEARLDHSDLFCYFRSCCDYHPVIDRRFRTAVKGSGRNDNFHPDECCVFLNSAYNQFYPKIPLLADHRQGNVKCAVGGDIGLPQFFKTREEAVVLRDKLLEHYGFASVYDLHRFGLLKQRVDWREDDYRRGRMLDDERNSEEKSFFGDGI
jgi:hypothetical protein